MPNPDVWHPTLDIQINWTYRLDLIGGCNADIYCPGNASPWKMARISAGSDSAARAYACLISASPDLLFLAEQAVIFGQGVLDLMTAIRGADKVPVEAMITGWQAVVAKAKGEVQ
jgi:hypothetical protein